MKILNYVIYLFTLSTLNNFSAAVELITGQQSLEFHGYIRSGLGFSKNGETQAKFQLPEARSKYRLGNEPDTSIELKFDYTYQLKDPENPNANIQSIIMLEGYKAHGDSNDFNESKKGFRKN